MPESPVNYAIEHMLNYYGLGMRDNLDEQVSYDIIGRMYSRMYDYMFDQFEGMEDVLSKSINN